MNILNPKKIKEEVAARRSQPTAWIWTFALLSIAFFCIYVVLGLNIFDVFGDHLKNVKKGVLLICLSCAILCASRIVEHAVAGRHPSPATRYNLIRMIRLLAVIVIIMVGASLLFENWYTAAVSLGLFSLLAGFALQTPITSLIGWLYIVIRTPYHVGERIQIDTFKGDVVDISYLDTTLREFGGDHLKSDIPSGRLIRFPNSLVLQSAVFNYSWNTFPYVWNEIPFHFAYESDLKTIEDVIRKVTKTELDQDVPVSEFDFKEYPLITFRINENTWVEASVTYLVSPKKAADTRSTIIKKVLAELNKYPDKAMFPKSNAR